MGALFISIILVIRFFQNYADKKSSMLMPGSFSEQMNYFAVTNLIAAFLSAFLVFLNKGGWELNMVTVLISMFSGMALTLSSIFGLMAMQSGAIALCSLFATAGLLVPCFGGMILFHARPSAIQWSGLVLFLLAATLLMKLTGKENTILSPRTFLLLIGSLLANGFTMLAQTLFTSYVPDGNVAVFSFLTFLIPGICLLVLSTGSSCILKKRPKRLPVNLLVYGCVSAISVFFINILATESTKMISPIILFSMINGGNTVIAAVVGRMFFKEKLSKMSIFVLLMAIAALIIIKSF